VIGLQMQVAFWSPGYDYVEIHTDKANLASRRIPEKLGFHIEDSYTCTPIGNQGTGKMDVWIKWNPFTYKDIEKSLPPKEKIDPFKWGQGARSEMKMAEEAALRMYSKDEKVVVDFGP
jgi:hypothetical protein